MEVGGATVTYYQDGAYSTYPDGTSYAAQPHATHHYHVIAHRCGYGDDTLTYSREHEVFHHLAGETFFGGRSPVLWKLAHGLPVDPAYAALEEVMVMALQRWVRANERPIVGDVDWDALKSRALTLLDGSD